MSIYTTIGLNDQFREDDDFNYLRRIINEIEEFTKFQRDHIVTNQYLVNDIVLQMQSSSQIIGIIILVKDIFNLLLKLFIIIINRYLSFTRSYISCTMEINSVTIITNG
jgi:hypothetical protein